MDRSPSGEGLPASQDHIDIGAAGQFGCDQRRARAEKRVIDQLARPAVVDDRTTHALDRLLRAVPPALLALRIAKGIVIGDLPDGGLRAATLPVAGPALAHGVPAGFVLPVIIAATQGEVLFGPDDLSARLQPASNEVGSHDIAVQRAVPDISDIPSKQRIGLPPVGAIVVEHPALRQLAVTEATAPG